MMPIEVLHLWFAAHADGDLAAARELVTDDLDVLVSGRRLRGFQSFMEWYRERRIQEGPSFGYSVDELLSGDAYAAAVLTLSARGRRWRQVALYRVQDDRISSIWAVEDDL